MVKSDTLPHRLLLRQRRDRAAFLRAAISAAILLLALAERWVPGPRTIDDSFITFRYARNILAGNGFTNNPREQVLCATTPLYTFLLAGAGALMGSANAPFPVIALLININVLFLQLHAACHPLRHPAARSTAGLPL